jgi:hypothetical protein
MSLSSTDTEERATWLIPKQDHNFRELLGKYGNQLGHDLKAMARDAMVKGAQLRMTDTSFPQELRLQVMKASVLYHSPTFTISSTTRSNTDDIALAMRSLFTKQQTSDALCDTLRELAEQAFFETSIFKVQKCLSQIKLGAFHSTAPFLDESGERVQHLELIAHVFPTVNCQAMLKEAATIWTSLKHRLPNLKACVLTVVFRSCEGYLSVGQNALNGFYTSFYENPFLDGPLREGSMSSECLGNKLTKLFADFAEKGPGVRRFVRIQHVTCHEFALIATPHYGPLVAIRLSGLDTDVHESPSGADMLTKAYRFARTGTRFRYTAGEFAVRY